MKVETKIEKHFAEKSHSVFERLKGGPFEHTKTFFFGSAKCFYFLSTLIKKRIIYKFKTFFTQICRSLKRNELLTARSSNCSISAKFSPMLVKMLDFGGVFNQKKPTETMN